MRRLVFIILLFLSSTCFGLQKNVASQKWVVFAFDETDNTAKTGDAGNITANLRIDGAAADGIDDTNPTELEDGYYIFDLAQGETNGDYILICPASTTANIQVIGCPMATWTTPPYFPAFSIDSNGRIDLIKIAGTTQTANDNGADINAILIDTAEIGAAGAGLTAVPWNSNWDAEVESEVDDSIGGGTGTALTAIPWNSNWDAEVESEVDDSIGGGTGTALTAIPWNSNWDAEVESEVEDAVGADVTSILTDTAAYDTDAEYAAAIWNAATASYGGAGTYGQAAEDILTDTSTTLDNFVDDLEGRLTSTRAGYLDNLSGGAVALASGVDITKIHGTAITESSSGRIAGNFTTFWDNADAATTKTVDDVGAVASGGGSELAINTGNLGDYKRNATVYFIWRTIDQGGAAVNPSTAGTVKVYKNNGTSEVTAPTGITDTRGFDTLTGIHLCSIDLSANSFYAVGQDYSVVLTGATIDSQSVSAVIATFSIEKRWTEAFYEY